MPSRRRASWNQGRNRSAADGTASSAQLRDWRAIWALNRVWTYEQTNDWVFDLDPEPAKVAESIASLERDADEAFADLFPG